MTSRSFADTLRTISAHWPVLETVQSTLLGLIVAMIGFAPRLVPTLLVLLALLTGLNALCTSAIFKSALRAAFLSPVGLSCLCFCAYALASALWSSDARFALITVAQVAAVLFSATYLGAALPRQMSTLGAMRRCRFVRAIPLGAVLALAFLVLELASEQALTIMVLNAFPGLSGDNTKDILREGSVIVGMRSFHLNRNIAAVVLLAPALLIAISFWVGKPLRTIWPALGGLSVLGVALASDSEAAKLAVAAGIITYALATRWPRRTAQSLAVILVFGVMFALPIGRLPYALGLDRSDWLTKSAKDRVLIWDHTAKAAALRPVFGIGVQSTRYQEPQVEPSAPESVPDRQLGWHAHNVFLQSWLELGAAGTAILLVAALALIRASLRLHRLVQPSGMALAAAVVAIAATGWGMWQPWLIGAAAAASVFLALLDQEAHMQQ